MIITDHSLVRQQLKSKKKRRKKNIFENCKADQNDPDTRQDVWLVSSAILLWQNIFIFPKWSIPVFCCRSKQYISFSGTEPVQNVNILPPLKIRPMN